MILSQYSSEMLWSSGLSPDVQARDHLEQRNLARCKIGQMLPTPLRKLADEELGLGCVCVLQWICLGLFCLLELLLHSWQLAVMNQRCCFNNAEGPAAALWMQVVFYHKPCFELLNSTVDLLASS